MRSYWNPQLPVLNVVIKKLKPCLLIHASFFMNVKIVMKCLDQIMGIVVCFVLTVMLSVHRSKRVIVDVVHLNLNSICRIGISNYCIDLELLAEG